MKPGSYSNLFNKFAGQEVPLEEKTVKIAGRDYKQLTLKNNPDPVLEEMRKTAKDNGLALRVWWPGIVGTMDYRTDRVNVYLAEDEKGKWRVQNGFKVG